jgi:hypothetical protein
MVEQQQGGSGAIRTWSDGRNEGLIEEVDGLENNNKNNCQTTQGDATIAAIIGSLRDQEQSARGNLWACRSAGSDKRFALRGNANRAGTRGARL